jgi:hypothetical protein
MSHDNPEHDPAPEIPRATSVYLPPARDANLPVRRARRTATHLGARACGEPRKAGAA